MKQLKHIIAAFEPCCEQERADKETILGYIDGGEELLTRENKLMHFTSSCWVMNPERTKALMVHHNIYNAWSWMGGHADGDTDLLAVAEREIREESGIHDLRLLTPGIFSAEILTVDGHEKRGKYVSSHLHYNVTYLFEADTQQETALKPDENSGVEWIEIEQLPQKVSEPWFLERIYSKLCDKVRALGI